MGEAPLQGFERECRVFTRYLLGGRTPTPYVLEHYGRLRPTIPAATGVPLPALDRLLLGLAHFSPFATRAADLYSRLVYPTSALRQALVLLLAILENSPPTHIWLDSAEVAGRSRLLGGLALSLLGSLASGVVGLLVLGPPHLVLKLAGAARGPRGVGDP